MAIPNLATYGGLSLEVGYAGQLTHDYGVADIDSKVSSSTARIDFGVAVARGSTDDTCKAIAADADIPMGITVRSANRPADESGNVLFSKGDSVPILKTGWIYAIPFENVTRGSGVLSITAQSGKLGGVNAGAAGNGRVVVPGAVWETTTLAGKVGKIRIVS